MSLSGTFQSSIPTSPFTPPRRVRPAPFSLRLNAKERARLAVEAAGAPLGAYIKEKLLGDAALAAKRRSRFSTHDRRALAQALALLGRSRIANNLNQLAHAANIGALPLTPDVEADIREAINEMRELRRLIMAALGSHTAGARP